jgi:ubiquinone/menaquinone biosynthesis C-methylase UbiE
MDDESGRLAEVYGEYASSPRRRRAWSRNSPANAAMLAELRGRLLQVAAPRLEGGTQVLDVGCGGGAWLRELAAEGVAPERLHGVDLIPARVSAASRSLPGADVRLADARRLPFEDDSFGLVLMLTALSSMPDATAAREATLAGLRVLEQGGLLVVYEPAHRGPPGSERLTITPERLADWSRGRARISSVTRLTVVPPLARPLGRLSARSYGLLARAPFLLTHRLTVLSA